MKYFEFSEPYFALIKAKGYKKAMEIYEEVVCDIEDSVEMKEISKMYALEKCKKCEDYTEEDIINSFDDDLEILLLMDGSLM